MPSFLPDPKTPITLLRMFITDKALHANGAWFNNGEQRVEHVVKIIYGIRKVKTFEDNDITTYWLKYGVSNG